MTSTVIAAQEFKELINEQVHLRTRFESLDSNERRHEFQPLRISGGSSKHFLANNGIGQPLDTRSLNAVVSYEPSELYITALCGTPLAHIEAALDERGQYLAFEPPNFNGQTTLGGALASGLSGPSRASVGGFRDYVLGLKMINGRAQELVFGGQVIKNVAGYDVSRLLCGSWGTLGLVTEVTVKVLPKSVAESSFVFHVDQQRAIELLSQWGQTALPINASFWQVHSADKGAVGELTIRLRGAAAAVASAAQWLGQASDKLHIQMDRLEEGLAQSLWDGCKNQTADFFTAPPTPDHCLWRLSVPAVAPAVHIEDVPAHAQSFEWNGGQRWIWAPYALASRIHQQAKALGGHATLWHVSAKLQSEHTSLTYRDELSPVQMRIQQSLQKQFDPWGIFDTKRIG
jgi:glycolate oxidase FAD binding subunit